MGTEGWRWFQWQRRAVRRSAVGDEEWLEDCVCRGQCGVGWVESGSRREERATVATQQQSQTRMHVDAEHGGCGVGVGIVGFLRLTETLSH